VEFEAIPQEKIRLSSKCHAAKSSQAPKTCAMKALEFLCRP